MDDRSHSGPTKVSRSAPRRLMPGGMNARFRDALAAKGEWCVYPEILAMVGAEESDSIRVALSQMVQDGCLLRRSIDPHNRARWQFGRCRVEYKAAAPGAFG